MKNHFIEYNLNLISKKLIINNWRKPEKIDAELKYDKIGVEIILGLLLLK